jgi:hypothetical protein
MICIIRTMNPVTLSFAQAILKDAGIESFLFDVNCSVLDGSTILVRKRLMIIDEDEAEARELLEAADLGKELEPAAAPISPHQHSDTFTSKLLRALGLKPK